MLALSACLRWFRPRMGTGFSTLNNSLEFIDSLFNPNLLNKTNQIKPQTKQMVDLDLNDDTEQQMVDGIFHPAIDQLSGAGGRAVGVGGAQRALRCPAAYAAAGAAACPTPAAPPRRPCCLVPAEDDRRLPQITAIHPMLRRGIGVHHSGARRGRRGRRARLGAAPCL